MSTRAPKAARPATAGLALGATGVVFGDIGTSPLYAFRESIMHAGGDPSEVAIGTASLAIWTITIIVSLKYLTFVMKANNNGEGGILALLALLRRWLDSDGKARFGSTRLRTFVLLALMIGAALLFGDGALTPAISVLSAVEGLGAVTPTLAPYVVPIAVAILVILFAVQSRGTESIGRVFGPVMIVWFIVIAVLGVLQILRSPEVLQALLPTHAISYLVTEGWAALGLLAVIILTVTGAEALTLGCSGLLRNHSSEASGSTSKSRPPGRIVSVLRWSSWLPVETGPLGNLASSVRMRPSSRWTSSAAPSNCRW